MRQGRLWIHESRRCGVAALTLPACATVAVIAIAFAIRGTKPQNTISIITMFANGFPLAAGLAATTAAARDRLIEVLLPLPTAYRTLVRRRLTVVTALVTGCAIIMITVLAFSGQWNTELRPLTLLRPMGPAILLIGTAILVQATLRSTAAASGVVIAVWLFQVVIVDSYIDSWPVNRVILTTVGAVLTALGMRLLANSEHQLASTDGGAQ